MNQSVTNMVSARTHSQSTKMFEERSEQVFFLAAEGAQAFVECVGEHLEVDAFHRSASEPDEPLAHYITTLYFDSETQEIARACEGGVDDVRLRAREYYDRLPELGIRREPLLWLEVKTRIGASTRKVRVAIPTHEIQTVLRDGVITEQNLHFESEARGESAQAVLREVAELCMHTAGPLRPDCIAHYRRRAWQDAAETLRITLDTELAFHRPPLNPFQGGMTLADALAEPPVARLSHSLVEIKARGEQPEWLRELIAKVGLEPALEGRRAFSKFVAASHAIHSI
ncbi:VTC domain-containing protein [Nannocystaceae bacterium ST9]